MHTTLHRTFDHWRLQRASCAGFIVGAALLAACNDGTGPGSSPQFGLAFRIDNPALSRSSGSGSFVAGGTLPVVTVTAAGLRIARDSDTIVVTKAQIVLRDVKMRKSGAACTDDETASSTLLTGSAAFDRTGSGKKTDGDEQECPSLRIGPFLIDLPVTGAGASTIAVNIPEGSYESVHFHLHPSGNSTPDDTAFLQQNPDFRGISIRLEGTHDTKPFIFVADVNAIIDVPLTAPLIVGAGGDNVTVAIDLAGWFARSSKGLYSPAIANVPGATRSQVLQNIRAAFRAFRDRDHDGRED